MLIKTRKGLWAEGEEGGGKEILEICEVFVLRQEVREKIHD